MTEIFLKLLNMSIAASWLVLAVILLRLLLKKAPKWICCLLWGMVALRLIVPFTLESTFSLIPSAEVIPQDITTTQTPVIYSGIPAINSVVNPLFTAYPTQTESVLDGLLSVASIVWLAGVAIILIYGAATYLKLHWQVRASVAYGKNIYVCDDVPSPFILGVFFPKIYLPSGMNEEQLQYVLAHENVHIKRKDHWWKPLGFLLLAVYWFNPLLWLAYIFLCRDIEQACDEKVIAGMDNAGKKSYSETLVACSVHRRTVMVCPVAFGEIGIKTRVKGILHYKKPGFWIVLASVVACVVTAVCFLTNPKPCVHKYSGEITEGSTCTQEGVQTHTCQLCKHSYTTLIELQPHTYNEGVVTEPSTCTQQGIREVSCTDCGEKKTETIEKAPHTAGEPFVVKEPNCTQQGERTATCTACAAVFQVEVLAVNDVHNMKETVLREATCLDAGEGVNICTRCDHSERVVYEPAAHNYVAGEEIPATCTREGSKQKVCTACGKEIWNSVPKSDAHIWFDMWGGLRQCALCGVVRSESRYNSSYSLLDGVTYAPQMLQLWPSVTW